MRFRETRLQGAIEIVPDRHADARGYFSETFRQDWFVANIAKVSFVQENQSLSSRAGAVRGLHCQLAPHAQGKLVRCLVGAIFDVAVDIRQGSPTYGQWTSATLTAEQGNQLWIPAGFLHGFCTLVPDCLVSYKVTAYYNKDADRGVRWDDPAIGVTWPDIADPTLLSAKDAAQPLLHELSTKFTIGEEA
ncbi:MAG: dTDP-4-dehydrorhamnose 3,5-epimerase [Candidatus Devosia phytovorans]|uniref:dTDP-4-dehydrorhamnose 3,5-epimerase n=1 Tax=Candidatus Devosia phytovorans TaxID=3121372 RepID=A0AAJ5VT84_9HYPH|nr:dTDP-4-dehydrorhamnose 3,5-epimerase [Devosia sp.]WEK03736.1 MAG: dTDP-4-dehydrorhamnose 3,5-epimerase [Devosia sp.]